MLQLANDIALPNNFRCLGDRSQRQPRDGRYLKATVS